MFRIAYHFTFTFHIAFQITFRIEFHMVLQIVFHIRFHIHLFVLQKTISHFYLYTLFWSSQLANGNKKLANNNVFQIDCINSYFMQQLCMEILSMPCSYLQGFFYVIYVINGGISQAHNQDYYCLSVCIQYIITQSKSGYFYFLVELNAPDCVFSPITVKLTV